MAVEASPSEFTKVKPGGYFSVTTNLCKAFLNLQNAIPSLTVYLRSNNNKEEKEAVDLDTINRFEVNDREELRDVPLFLMPLLFDDESRDSGVDCSTPMVRRLLTEWQPNDAADEIVARSQPVVKSSKWQPRSKSQRQQYPWAGSLRFSVYALILLRAADGTGTDRRGEFRRIGITQVYSDRSHVQNLRQACQEAEPSEEMYNEHYPARHAYRIKVI